MKFSYSCIGDNTQENREWLEKVGYARQKDTPIDGDVILTYLDESDIWVYETAGCLSDYVDTDRSSVINCIGNSPLFQAVSAMREDSDLWQWFTDGKVWVLCKGDRFSYWYVRLGYYIEFSLDTIHKATLAELQERFKLK